MTRLAQNPQMQIGQVDISKIQISSKSRDDIPKLLKGLQFIYSTPSVRKEIFELLEAQIAPEVDKNNGRPGMELWKILVMGVLRLSLNCDYDRLHEQVCRGNSVKIFCRPWPKIPSLFATVDFKPRPSCARSSFALGRNRTALTMTLRRRIAFFTSLRRPALGWPLRADEKERRLPRACSAFLPRALVNQHKTIREMLGHADFFDKIEWV